MPEESFESFGPELVVFLNDVKANNDRDWFKANKKRYEADVRGPALAFIREMGPMIRSLSPHFLADDRKVGGALMRIHRDTRFSKDKSPYKTNVGIQFRHGAGKDVHAPGFYVHIGLDGYFLGVGMWRPDNPSLVKIRALIDAEQDRWREVVGGDFAKHFKTHTEDMLKRPPRGYAKDHPLVEALRRKSHLGVSDLTEAQITSPDLPDLVYERFGLAMPLVRFLCEAIDVPC